MPTSPDPAAACAAWLSSVLPEAVRISSWGEEGWFYNPGRTKPRGVYVATLKQKDGANDRASQLDRSGAYRLNIGVPPYVYEHHFGPRPARPPAGGVVQVPFDFTATGLLTPHPVYAWMGWMSIVCPTESQFPILEPLLLEAWTFAEKKSRAGGSPRR